MSTGPARALTFREKRSPRARGRPKETGKPPEVSRLVDVGSRVNSISPAMCAATRRKDHNGRARTRRGVLALRKCRPIHNRHLDV